MDSESVQVREFIEKLVEKLVNGGLDDVCVSKLHTHPECKPLPEEDSPTAAHAALKKLIHNIIQEAMTLPTMQEDNSRKTSESNCTTQDDVAFKTYEDILATAILNKVIERYQAHRFNNETTLDGNRNLLGSTYSVSSMDTQTKYISSLEIGVNKVDNESTSSKEISETDSDDLKWSKSDLTDPSISLTIEERIEEVTTYSNSDVEEHPDGDEKLFVPDLNLLQRRVPFPEFGIDIIEDADVDNNDDESDDFADASAEHQPTDIVSPVESWEENWLFQRRRLKPGGGSPQMPVPMLVPNPSEDFKALIGDRDAEDVSDLSECSDSALEDMVLAEVNPAENMTSFEENALKTNDHLSLLVDIGESSDFNCIKEEEIQTKHSSDLTDSPIKPVHQGSLLDVDLDVSEATNMELLKTSIDCSSEFGQKDSEYTEDYDAVTQRQMDSLTNLSEPEQTIAPIPQPRSLAASEEANEHTKEEDVPQISLEGNSSAPGEDESINIIELAVPPRPGTGNTGGDKCTLPCTGTIAEREHKKWETAPPLPNNPYSPENISKRLNRKKFSSSQSSSSEASVEFPDLKTEVLAPAPATESLHIVCAPGDLDYKRYGRDYYVNSKTAGGEKKSTPSVKVTSLETKQKQVIPEASRDDNHLETLPKSEESTPSATKKITGNTITQKIVNVQQEESFTHQKKEVVSKQNKNVDYQSDPEIPAPGTVVNEIARWQNVINETEQLWMKNTESVEPDTNSDTVDKTEDELSSNKNKSSKHQNGEVKPKIADVYLQEINNIKMNGDIKQKSPQISDIYLEEINNIKQNRSVKSRISNINFQENINMNDAKVEKLNNNIQTKTSKISETYLEEINNLKQNGDVKMRVASFQENGTSSDSENINANENEQSYLLNKNNKPIPKPRSDKTVEIIHKANVKETEAHVEIVTTQPEIKINAEMDDLPKQIQRNSSPRLDTMSVTSEGSVASSDSDLYNFLPSVKRLAKQFSGTQDSDSSTSSFKCPSPAPKWKKVDERTTRTPITLSPIPDAVPMMDTQQSPKNSLSPIHPVREVHSLTARSISREFREGLKRNLPSQMDRNLHTVSSDSSHSTPRSVHMNNITTQEDDSTHGYTSDESSTHSSSPTNEINEMNKRTKPKTLQNSIAFWEQLQHK